MLIQFQGLPSRTWRRRMSNSRPSQTINSWRLRSQQQPVEASVRRQNSIELTAKFPQSNTVLKPTSYPGHSSHTGNSVQSSGQSAAQSGKPTIKHSLDISNLKLTPGSSKVITQTLVIGKRPNRK